MLKVKDYLKTVKSKSWLFVLPFCVELTESFHSADLQPLIFESC